LKLRVAVILNDGLLINPESWTLAPVSLYTSKRYCSGPSDGSNLGVEADAVSVGWLSDACASLMGEVGVGALTFSVDPSADASAPGVVFELGDVGDCDCRLHANVNASAAKAAVIANRDPFMRRLLLAKGASDIGML
jgi:hypothetical protein